jgi:hypothetical protein
VNDSLSYFIDSPSHFIGSMRRRVGPGILKILTEHGERLHVPPDLLKRDPEIVSGVWRRSPYVSVLQEVHGLREPSFLNRGDPPPKAIWRASKRELMRDSLTGPNVYDPFSWKVSI